MQARARLWEGAAQGCKLAGPNQYPNNPNRIFLRKCHTILYAAAMSDIRHRTRALLAQCFSGLVVLGASLLSGCLAQPLDEADGGVRGNRSDEAPSDDARSNDTRSDSSDEPQPPATCTTSDAATNPVVTLRGTACGETVNFTTRAGKVLHLGRSSAADPPTEIRLVEVLDSTGPADLAKSQFLVNLAFSTGPELFDGVSYHNLTSGVFSLCGFGTIVFQEGPVTFQLTGTQTDDPTDDVTLSLTGLVVSGYAPEHGQTRVRVCGGELDMIVRGKLSR
jgi:hypothetical protein